MPHLVSVRPPSTWVTYPTPTSLLAAPLLLSTDPDDEDSDDGTTFMVGEGWLVPETRETRRKALNMRGARSNSVERLEDDDLHHISAKRAYKKSGRYLIPRPCGRRLIEDR